MKIYLFLLLSIGVYAWAELPDTVSDKAINTNLENLDMKTAKAQKDINAVVNTSGAINMGLNIVTTTTGSTTACSSTCGSGYKVLGGGCSNPSATLQNSYPSSSTAWTCNLDAATTCTAYAICGKVQ